MMTKEIVEVCPHCMSENVFVGWNVTLHGFVAKCWQCGNEIMLCDECLHADDNRKMRCDWHGVYKNGKMCGGTCFRGLTRQDTEQERRTKHDNRRSN